MILFGVFPDPICRILLEIADCGTVGKTNFGMHAFSDHALADSNSRVHCDNGSWCNSFQLLTLYEEIGR